MRHLYQPLLISLLIAGCGGESSDRNEQAATTAPKPAESERSTTSGQMTGDASESAVPPETAVTDGTKKETPKSEVQENPLRDAYFGETHLHTGVSMDAFIGGNRLTPDDAYRFARGE